MLKFKIVHWLFSALMAWSPYRPSDSSFIKRFPDAVETQFEQVERYWEIAQDLTEVVTEPEYRPAHPGPNGAYLDAIHALGIALYESQGFRLDIDHGLTRGDHGESVCIMQVRVKGKTAEGWTRDDLIQDRRKCFRAALRIMRESFRRCGGANADGLSGYTTGKCKLHEPYAMQRYLVATYWLRNHPIPLEN